MVRRLLLLACLVAVAGCDRAVLDPVGAELLVSDPDLSVVQLEPDLRLRLLAPEFGGPLAVQVAGRPAPFDSAQGAYVLDVQLARGLNALPLAVTDDAGAVDRDTLYAVYLPLRPAALTGLSGATRRADAAAAPLGGGRWIVSGGAGPDGRALASAETVSQTSAGFVQVLPFGLETARTGHTATPLDGGTLLLGGTTTDEPGGAADFVPDAEWVGPDGRTARVAVEGGLARARHTARALSTEDGTFVYLYGGVTPAGRGLARSGTVDVYRVDGSDAEMSLARLSPPGGSGAFPAVADHLQIPTGATSAAVRGLTAGDPVAFSFVWSRPGTATFPFSLRTSPARATPQTPRTRAASVDVGGGLALVVGGEAASGGPLSTLEVFSVETGRSFRVPASVGLQRARTDAVATILSGGRIVVSGGRVSGGDVISGYESFQL